MFWCSRPVSVACDQQHVIRFHTDQLINLILPHKASENALPAAADCRQLRLAPEFVPHMAIGSVVQLTFNLFHVRTVLTISFQPCVWFEVHVGRVVQMHFCFGLRLHGPIAFFFCKRICVQLKDWSVISVMQKAPGVPGSRISMNLWQAQPLNRWNAEDCGIGATWRTRKVRYFSKHLKQQHRCKTLQRLSLLITSRHFLLLFTCENFVKLRFPKIAEQILEIGDTLGCNTALEEAMLGTRASVGPELGTGATEVYTKFDLKLFPYDLHCASSQILKFANPKPLKPHSTLLWRPAPSFDTCPAWRHDAMRLVSLC